MKPLPNVNEKILICLKKLKRRTNHKNVNVIWKTIVREDIIVYLLKRYGGLNLNFLTLHNALEIHKYNEILLLGYLSIRAERIFE